MPRIGLIHATPLAIAPAASAFAEHWPEAEVVNLLDESLQSDAADSRYTGPSFDQPRGTQYPSKSSHRVSSMSVTHLVAET